MQTHTSNNTANTSASVLMINTQGIMLSVQGHDYFLSYNRIPWIQDAPLRSVLNVKMKGTEAIEWPDLNVDIEIDDIRYSEHYPLFIKPKPLDINKKRIKEVVRVKCGNCHALLDVRNKLKFVQKTIKCPNCGNLMVVRFSEEQKDEERIICGPSVNTAQTSAAGFLVYNNKSYPLSFGRNTIGRKSPFLKSAASVPIETNGDHTMSHIHGVIEIVNVNGSVRALISHGGSVIPLLVDGIQVSKSDKLYLKDGAEIKMGNILLKYTLTI